MKRALRLMGIGLLLLIVGVIVVVSLFVNISPQFGKAPSQEQKEGYSQTGHYNEGKFLNRVEKKMDIDIKKGLQEMLSKNPHKRPGKDIDPIKISGEDILNHPDSITQLTWFGHSTFLVQIDGKNILLDPMFSEVAAPHPWLGEKRYSRELPIEIGELPQIDIVILSHDHYDHLDYESIKTLVGKVDMFVTPLGVGNHLRSWGVEENKLKELDWWEDISIDNITLVCTPARHFSGRGFFDRGSTLWSSWVIKGENDKVYFSGDSGYDIHFKEIGEKYGPFDIALLECGQYNEDWKFIHMMPEETAQAAIDLNTKIAMPIHWGAFTLAYHEWTEPVERMLKKADELKIQVTTPRIGEKITIDPPHFPSVKWWNDYIYQEKQS